MHPLSIEDPPAWDSSSRTEEVVLPVLTRNKSYRPRRYARSRVARINTQSSRARFNSCRPRRYANFSYYSKLLFFYLILKVFSFLRHLTPKIPPNLFLSKIDDNKERFQLPKLARDNHKSWFRKAKLKCQSKDVWYTVETTIKEYI